MSSRSRIPATANALPIPPGVEKSKCRVELARLWETDDDEVSCVNVAVWEDPTDWAAAIVKLTLQVAAGYAELYGEPEAEMLSAIRGELATEWQRHDELPPVGETSGRRPLT